MGGETPIPLGAAKILTAGPSETGPLDNWIRDSNHSILEADDVKNLSRPLCNRLTRNRCESLFSQRSNVIGYFRSKAQKSSSCERSDRGRSHHSGSRRCPEPGT